MGVAAAVVAVDSGDAAATKVSGRGRLAMRRHHADGEIGDALETVEIDLLPVVGGAVIVLVEIGEDMQHRPPGGVERRLIARSVSVALRLEVEPGVPVERVEQCGKLPCRSASVDDQMRPCRSRPTMSRLIIASVVERG